MLIRKLFKAEMAHAVPGAYTGRCHHVHGHSYKFELFLKSSAPNPSMMVMDFTAIKQMGLRDFMDSFDHSVLIWKDDPSASAVAQINPDRHMVVPFVPTAEMIAKSLYWVCRLILEGETSITAENDVHVAKVLVHETETGMASFGTEDVSTDSFPPVRLADWVISDGIRRDWKTPDWLPRIIKKETCSGR